MVIITTIKDRDGCENGYMSWYMLDYKTMKHELSVYDGIQPGLTSHTHIQIGGERERERTQDKFLWHKWQILPMNSKLLLLTVNDFDSENIISYRMLIKTTRCFKTGLTLGIVKAIHDLIQADYSEIALNVTSMDGVHFSDILQLNIKLTDLKMCTVSSTHSIWQSFWLWRRWHE